MFVCLVSHWFPYKIILCKHNCHLRDIWCIKIFFLPKDTFAAMQRITKNQRLDDVFLWIRFAPFQLRLCIRLFSKVVIATKWFLLVRVFCWVAFDGGKYPWISFRAPNWASVSCCITFLTGKIVLIRFTSPMSCQWRIPCIISPLCYLRPFSKSFHKQLTLTMKRKIKFALPKNK